MNAEILVLGPRRTRRIIGSVFRISYHPHWQIVNRFLIGQPYGAYSNPGTQAVGAEGFHRCFAEGLNQSSVSSVTQATQPLVRGTQREYSSKPLKHRIVKRILVFER